MKTLFGEEAVTRDIMVRVSISYLSEQSELDCRRCSGAYYIRIENGSHQAVQLLTRHWIISDGRGARYTVEGEGVIGEQPMITPGASYDYVSGCSLATPTGSMQGSYETVGVDGMSFDVAIPNFALRVPAVAE